VKKIHLVMLFLAICLILAGCSDSTSSSRLADEFKKELTKELASVVPQPDPSDYIPFGDGEWHEACLITRGREFLICSNQKLGGSAKIIIWSSYSREQDFSISGYEEHPHFTKDEPNKGEDAKLLVTQANVNQVDWKMASDGVGEKEIELFMKSGDYLYRISIDAFDNGWHASYVIKQSTPANYALIKSTLDDQSSWRATLHYPASRSTSDVRVDCKPVTRIVSVNIDKNPITHATFIYVTDGNKVNQTLETSTLELDAENLPSTVSISKTIDGETARNSIKDLKSGKTYHVILATDQQRIDKYKDDLSRFGKIIWGDKFNLSEYFKIDMNTEGITQFETNVVTDSIRRIYGTIRFDKNGLLQEDVETAYHEAAHALWEYSSISNAGGTRDSIWKPLPNTPENKDVVAENFALDEAQAHMAGFYAVKYYKGVELADSEYTIEKAKKAVNDAQVPGNEIEGVVTTFLLELYKHRSFEDALRDMKEVKDSYYVTNGRHPQNVREFIAEKLKLSDEQVRTEIVDLAKELEVDPSIAPGGSPGSASTGSSKDAIEVEVDKTK